MSKKSKRKGDRWERQVCKDLNKWWQTKNLEGEFYRTPASGGLKWKSREDTIGDVTTPEVFTHTVEVKHNEAFQHKQFFEIGKPNKNNLWGWWQQACDEADRANRFPWLIVKKNYCKPLLIFTVVDEKTLFFSTKLTCFTGELPVKEKLTGRKWDEITVYFWEEFLEIGNPEMFCTEVIRQEN